MEETIHISRSAPEFKSQDFAFLREEAMELLRSTASETWTDHNLHDPGITLLEAFCYALTEMGLRSGMDVKDLVASDISGHQQKFYRASEILPVAPVISDDIRKILIDHPLVKNAWVHPVDSSPKGRYSVLLEFLENRLNRNTFSVSVEPASLSETYQIDLALPWWDEEEVIPFGNDVEIQTIDIDAPSGEEWRTITGDSIYYTKLDVTFQPTEGGTESTEIWVIAGINTPIEDPVVEAPLILSELTSLVMAIGDNSPSDQTLLKRLNRWVSDTRATMRSIRRYLKNYRNLCEEFTEFNAVRPQEIAILANIDVKQGVQIENLLADIFLNIDHHISPQNVFEDLITLQEQQTNDQIYEGPLLDSGFLPDTFMSSATVPATLYTSDILRVMLQVRGLNGTDVIPANDRSSLNITSVRNLSLSNYLDNRPITTNARDCLGLVESRRHIPRLSLTKSHITVYRNGVELETDNEQVIELFNEKKEASRASQVPGTRDVLPPEGNRYAVNEYYPAQNDLPLVYGVGEAGLPDTASDERKSLALQLKGYLFHFEQLIAGVASQLAHFNAFFSADPDLEQTLFQQPLYHLPGAPYLLKSFDSQTIDPEDFSNEWEAFTNDPDNGYATVLKESQESREQFLDRRNRMLDHQLANFGEDMEDRSAFILRKAITTEERNIQLNRLIHDKAAFIHDLPELEHSRAQSFGNPVFRKKFLLQTQSVQDGVEWVINDMNSVPVFRGVSLAQSEISAQKMAAVTLTLATSEDHYSILEEPGGQHRVVISASPGADPDAESVSTHDTPADAETAVENLLQTVMELWMRYAITPLQWRVYHMLGIESKERKSPVESTEEDQGFYMVEHLLLAPASDTGTPLIMDDSKDPYSFQITFLFPSGYARDFSDEEAEKQVTDAEEYRDPEYRKFAETQIRKACPAHILPRVLWIDRILEGSPTSTDAPAFENFEQRYRAWLEVWFTDGTTDSEMEPLQNDLVEILNLIYQDAGN